MGWGRPDSATSELTENFLLRANRHWRKSASLGLPETPRDPTETKTLSTQDLHGTADPRVLKGCPRGPPWRRRRAGDLFTRWKSRRVRRQTLLKKLRLPFPCPAACLPDPRAAWAPVPTRAAGAAQLCSVGPAGSPDRFGGRFPRSGQMQTRKKNEDQEW